jgi:hypothetical protein
MLKRLWFVLSVAWAALVFFLQGEPSGRLVGVALFPLIGAGASCSGALGCPGTGLMVSCPIPPPRGFFRVVHGIQKFFV